MKKIVVRIGTLVSIVAMILIAFTTIATAEDEYDCPASIGNRETTPYAYAYGIYDSNTQTTTYSIDTVNKPGGEIIELCIYPNPDIDISDSDMTPLYDSWQIDNPGSKPGFGFIARGGGATRMPLDGAVNTVGSVRYTGGPSPSETLLFHIADPDQCGGSSTCWLFPSTEAPQNPPVADPNGPYTDIEGIGITFDGSGSFDIDGTITSYLWDFGDGNTGTGVNPVHTYIQNGAYIVTLTVTDNSGATNSSTTTANITDTGPIALFFGTPLSGEEPLIVTFTDSSTSYDGITLWKWDFDNNGIIDSTEQNPIYEYTLAGTYTVKLTVCENDGDCASSTGNITVTPASEPTVTPTTTPPSGDTSPPSQPLCPIAIAINPTTINVSWQASVDNIGVAGYKVYRSLDGETYYQIATVTNLYYIDSGLTTGTTYYYVIIAFDTAGNPSIQSDETYATPRDINPPVVTVPSNMIVEATSPSGAIVTFSASAIDDIDGSIIPTCNPESGSTFPLGTTTVTCTATDSSGNEDSAIFTILVRDTTPPTPPSELIATAISTSRIDLSWTASSDAVGTIKYTIYRSLDGITFTSIGATTSTSFQNTGLTASTTYYYYIIAIDSAGNPSISSNIASATTFAPPPSPTPTEPGPTSTPGTPGPTLPPPPPPDYPPELTLPDNMVLEATSPSGAVATFSVSAYDNEDAEYKTVTCDYSSGSTFPIETTIVTCSATDNTGHTTSGIFSITVQDTTPPTPPSDLVATAISTSRIDLGWTASTDLVGVRNYYIYRSLDNIYWRGIGITSGTSFINTGLIPNTTYYYRVVAYDLYDNPSDPSNEANARTFAIPPSPLPTPSPTGTAGPTSTAPSPTTTIDPCAPPQSGNTPQGQAVEVAAASTVGVRFDTVLECGDTTAVAYYDDEWTPLPNDYQKIVLYDIDTSATYSDSITISIKYSNVPSNIDEQTLRLFHYEDGNWVDVTTALDTTQNIITGRVSSLSPFAIGGITGSGSGSGGGNSGGGILRGPTLNNVGIIMLGISLISIGILRLRKRELEK